MLAVALAGMAVTGTSVSLATTAVVGSVLGAGLGAFSGFSPPGTAPLLSVAMADPVTAARDAGSTEWARRLLVSSLLSVVAAVALGVWAARHRLLDEPAAHRRLLASGRRRPGSSSRCVAGLPLALAAVGVWRPGVGMLLLSGALHTVGGYAGGLGYAAAFGLLAAGARGPGPAMRALAAGGQRSLSCYLGQSVVFATLLPAWALGLGARLTVTQAALLAVGVWLALLLIAAVSARAGYRGPAEVLLRRLTYGRPRRSRA